MGSVGMGLVGVLAVAQPTMGNLETARSRTVDVRFEGAAPVVGPSACPKGRLLLGAKLDQDFIDLTEQAAKTMLNRKIGPGVRLLGRPKTLKSEGLDEVMRVEFKRGDGSTGHAIIVGEPCAPGLGAFYLRSADIDVYAPRR